MDKLRKKYNGKVLEDHGSYMSNEKIAEAMVWISIFIGAVLFHIISKM